MSLRFFWPLLVFVCLPMSAHALPEAAFPAGARAVLEPFFNSGQAGTIEGEKTGTFASRKKVMLGYRKWELADEKGAVVFIPGRGDAFQVFQETFYALVKAGYSVYALDERGQGSSDRLLKDKQESYVDDFDNYVKDLKRFVTQIVNAKPHAKRILMSHSMGGGVSARYLIQHPGDFDGAVLVAPMLKINTKPYQYDLAEFVIAPALAAALRGKHYAPNRGPFDPNEKFTDDNELTTSPIRFQAYHQIFVDHEELQVGGATVHWVLETFSNTRKVHLEAFTIKTPILILTAGRDSIVDDDEEGWFCSRVKTCKQFVLPEAKHNIFIETDKNRDQAMEQILEFLAR